MKLLLKKIFLFSFYLCLLVSGGVKAHDANFKKLSVDFPYDKNISVINQKGISYSLKSYELNLGNGLLYTGLLTKKSFYSHHPNIVKLCNRFTESLLNTSYNRIGISRQLYLVDNLEEELLDRDLIREDPDFRKTLFKKAKFYIPKTKKKKYHWIITNIPEGNFKGMRSRGKSYSYKFDDFSASDLTLFEKLNNISSDRLSRVTVTEVIDPRYPVSGSAYKMSKERHPYFKGSFSISFFYNLLNAKNEYLVVSYNVGSMKKPSFVNNYLIKKLFEIFQGGVKDSIMGIRKYLYERY